MTAKRNALIGHENSPILFGETSGKNINNISNTAAINTLYRL